MKVTGSGSDDIGVFTIDGTYSTETNRIDLIKTYQLGTGNSLENFGHQVTIQLTWDKTNSQFEGTWNIETDRYCDNGICELKFNTELIQIQSDSNGTFNSDSSYPEQLNSYVTREDYLRLLSIINPLMKEIKRYKRYKLACLMPCVFLFMVVLTFGIFWRTYFNVPAVFYIMVELLVLIGIIRTIVNTIDSKTILVTEKLKATVKTFSDETFASPFTNPSEWTIQIDDFLKCTLSIKLLPPSQKDLVNTEATTNSFIL
ncbi:unnamed protein product [Adineta steineri]|uniref:Uncharacterized protein n=1 Tax=Adineta steineri TaxID=433720 RepID=A0A815L932_9BILA|nr:unnamed protein product [Adineta steineri]CAF3695228.1 unnamed protein product [Adineta steineri]